MMPRPELTDMTNASDQKPKTANVKPKSIPIVELANEYLPTLPRSYFHKTKQVINILLEMDIRSTRDLSLTPEFIDRFLSTWGGSILHDQISQMLILLGRVRDFAIRQCYLESSESCRLVKLPPEWDDRHERFAQADRVLSSHYCRLPNTDLTFDQFVLMTAHLKDHSREWLNARLLMMVALIVLARLSPKEAKALRRADVDQVGPDRRIRITGRTNVKIRYGISEIFICKPLATLLDRWLPRTGSEYLLPNQARSQPWDFKSNMTGGSLTNLLSDACRAAGLPVVRIKDLRRFGEANIARLTDEFESPFRTVHGDGVLQSKAISIDQLSAMIIAHYHPSQRTSLSMTRIVFETIRAMPGIQTTRDMEVPDFVDRFAARAGISDPSSIPRNQLLSQLSAILTISISFGYIDSNPFANPGYSPVMKLKVAQRPPAPARRRSAVRSTNQTGVDSGLVVGLCFGPALADATISQASAPAPDEPPRESSPWDNWDASFCPIHVLEDGHLVVFGKRKRRLISEKKIQLVLGLVERYPKGGFDKPGLIKRFGKGARQAFYWLKRIDPECDAAFQPAMIKARSLYRIGRPDL